jgi:spore coat polysaccharide biosynthesis protein SpsF
MGKTGVIIQARNGSTRLPNKMVLPFYQKKTILEVQLAKLSIFPNLILATTDLEIDDELATTAIKNNALVYRGSEKNVLQRFTEAAKHHNLTTVIRICADNPFLNIELLKMLLKNYNDEDYFSFMFKDGTPTILTHLGVFGEITSTEALIKASEATTESIYLEHVTNYIYTHKNSFNTKTIHLPETLVNAENIRLTVDTLNDFNTVKHLFEKFPNIHSIFDLQKLINHINSNPILFRNMTDEIIRNTK